MLERNIACGRRDRYAPAASTAILATEQTSHTPGSAEFPQFAEIVPIPAGAALAVYRACSRGGAPRAGNRAAPDGNPSVPRCHQNRRVDLARIAWLATVLACLVAVVILALDRYYGYAGVTLAVALSAAINLR